MNTKDLELSFVDDPGYDEESGNAKLEDGQEFSHEDGLGQHGDNPFASLQTNPQNRSCINRLLNCFFGSNLESPEFQKCPDEDFYADSLIELSHGFTAYRLLEPSHSNIHTGDDSPPVIVLLHGMQNASYMWADIAELLADFEQGPQAQVLVFDFYGHGRSPWTGVPLSLDLYVNQIRELLDGEWLLSISLN
jgi:predicted alpha/beta-fold hydrolase